MEVPKYSLPEIERRWLVPHALIGPMGLHTTNATMIEDRYVHGTRLRLRMMSPPGATPVYKLCKKYGANSAISEPITNIYLTAAEHQILAALPAARLTKCRHKIAGGALDVFEAPHSGLIIFEREFASEAEAHAYQPPPFVDAEITGDTRYTGNVLAART